MALQSSGTITLAQVQSEFGGSNPISMSEYYRGGSYVPTTVGSAAGSYSSYYGNLTSYYWEDTAGGFLSLVWNGTNVYNSSSGTTATTITASGYDYNRGTLFHSSGGGKGGGPTTNYYRIRRRTTATTTTVNTNIPSSGTISMNQFYGGRNS